jgi:hypothetical protein
MCYGPKISNHSSWVSLSTRRALRLNDYGITNQASVMCYIEEIDNAMGSALYVTVGTLHTATVLSHLDPDHLHTWSRIGSQSGINQTLTASEQSTFD